MKFILDFTFVFYLQSVKVRLKVKGSIILLNKNFGTTLLERTAISESINLYLEDGYKYILTSYQQKRGRFFAFLTLYSDTF